MATNWECLVTDNELDSAAKIRKENYIKDKISINLLDEYKTNGWEVEKEYSNEFVMMKKIKSIGELFENEVWTIFYKMGFKIMNSNNGFKLDFNFDSKQIDVIAIDDEVCLLIECKATEKFENTKQWKTDLESINGNYNSLCNEINKKYPNRKIKYIFATKNYLIGDADLNRMRGFGIANFDYEVIKYYKELVNHLGSAARYQLLGNLFAKMEINGMNDMVPAIEGKMGELKYYTFLIEPERLLKLAYVLHRNKANHNMMPTYQRLIKKERLKSIRKYVDEGGYFPNSIIVSIDTNGKGIKFEQVSIGTNNNQSKIGELYLPKTYQSLYIIDGQHRLYGYSDSKYAESNCIPVVAFIDMKKNDQVKMFMDINENQKSVPKSLRNTLNIDLLWDAELYSQRQEALRLDIGLSLGENNKSPLYGRIVTGEDTSDSRRCITLDYINKALKRSDFLNVYKKNKNDILKYGTFDKMNNDETKSLLYLFLVKCFKLIKDYCNDEWEKGEEGFLTINNTTYAIIRIFNDIVNIILDKQNKSIVDNCDGMLKKCEDLLLNLADTINSLNPEIIYKIKNARGEAAKKDTYNLIRVEFHNQCSEFSYKELEEYIKENCVNNNPYASQYIRSIKDKIVNLFKTHIGNDLNWKFKYLPEKLKNELTSKCTIENEKRKYNGNPNLVDEWDYISFKEIAIIANYGSNWKKFCQEILNRPSLKTNKINTLSWLNELDSAKNRIDNGQSIVTSQFNNIELIYKDFCEEKEMVGTN